MTVASSMALEALKRAALGAEKAEMEFRESAARQIERLEADRRNAYRRHSFLNALVAADATAADRDASRAAQRAAAAAELEWEEIGASQKPVIDALEPLADAVHDARLASVETEAGAEQNSRETDLLMALAAFEAWYEAYRGKPFVALFERYYPETPVVDF